MTRLAFVAGLFASLACFCLHAQTIDLRANIPFDFRMGEVLMPAGEYKIHQSAGILTVRSESGSPAAVTLTLPASRKVASTDGTLVFNRYGDSYFLTTVWTPNSRGGITLPKSSREKELVARAGSVQTAGIPLQRK
jgi:hypothetical protein